MGCGEGGGRGGKDSATNAAVPLLPAPPALNVAAPAMELLLSHPAVADGVVSFLDTTSVSALRIVHWRIAASSFYDRVLMLRLRRLQRSIERAIALLHAHGVRG